MTGQTLRGVMQVAIGVVIAALVLQTWLVLGWIAPVTVSGSSMAPALLGPHRLFRCPECRCEFAAGLDQLPPGDLAVCPHCGQRRATSAGQSDRRGQRLAIDRTAFVWREPRRWEVVVFRCPENASQLCVKRVVGLPGEAVALDGGDVFVDGRIARKSLAEQRAVRQPVYAPGDYSEIRTIRVGQVLIHALPRWNLANFNELEYRHVGDGPITDESSYNQGVTPPSNSVNDIMLTIEARLKGQGQLVFKAATQAGRCELIADLARREVVLRCDGRIIGNRRLPPPAIESSRFVEWTFSLFDGQLLVAVGDEVVLAESWQRDQMSSAEPSPRLGPQLSIGVRSAAGEIRRLAVWRDVYYAVRHRDGRQLGAERGETVTWRLGPAEFFVLGDNAAISDDSRSWLSGPGLDAKLLIGKPLGAR